MAGHMMNMLRMLAPALALLVVACNPSAQPVEKAPLEGARIGGPFKLIDQDGRTRTESDFAGRNMLVYFGYTFCPDVCPIDLAKLAAGLKALEKSDPDVAQRIVPIFITIDPERDTPAQMKSYVEQFHPRLVGLTGSKDAIAAAARGYSVYFSQRENDDGGEYLMDHSRAAYLIGPKGEPVALIAYDGTPAAIAAELKKWAR